nr:hypothetical protein [uncultured Brevundimonas sp.]
MKRRDMIADFIVALTVAGLLVGYAPPRLALPHAAAKPCPLPVLPDNPSAADLDTAYMQRDAQVVTCDATRAWPSKP